MSEGVQHRLWCSPDRTLAGRQVAPLNAPNCPAPFSHHPSPHRTTAMWTLPAWIGTVFVDYFHGLLGGEGAQKDRS